MTEQDSFFLDLGSMTQAHKAQKLLEERGISSKVGKMQSGIGGCSYGLYVKNKRKEEVTLLLRASSVKIL